MGFAQFLSEPDFAGKKMIRDMCSDAGDYDRMIKLYEEKRKPLFFFNVTLQTTAATDGSMRQPSMCPHRAGPQAEHIPRQAVSVAGPRFGSGL